MVEELKVKDDIIISLLEQNVSDLQQQLYEQYIMNMELREQVRELNLDLANAQGTIEGDD